MSAGVSYDVRVVWRQFLEHVQGKCTQAAFNNWFAPVQLLELKDGKIFLQIPNIFVKGYLLSNYKPELDLFFPYPIEFLIKAPEKIVKDVEPTVVPKPKESLEAPFYEIALNDNYRFENFIEGPNNQFVKSAAIGVAMRPGQSYNPLFIHGPVGLGKTHLLHSIGHYVQSKSKKLRVLCITTESFVNHLVESLKNKSLDKMKRFYRQEVDVLLLDDIQFLQNRLNFEEELCNLIEALRNQNKQIVITSDKPPASLRLSERMIARMEWGLVAHVGVPELETRVAILQQKAKLKGIEISQNVAFFIAEHIYNNVRQLEGAINRLCAHCRLLNIDITEDLVRNTLREMIQHVPNDKVTVEDILKSVATVFQVKGGVKALKGVDRKKDVALPRQVAMYLANKLIRDSLQALGISFNKTHSTIIHACRSIEKKAEKDESLRRQIGMVERDINGK